MRITYIGVAYGFTYYYTYILYIYKVVSIQARKHILQKRSLTQHSYHYIDDLKLNIYK